MPKALRYAPGGMVFHCINRGNGRHRIFDDEGDYAAFEKVLGEALARVPLRLLAYCLMPNHWHLILWPSADGQLPAFMHWLTLTHVRRWHAYQHTEGGGHLYQGTYKSFPVQDDGHYLVVASKEKGLSSVLTVVLMAGRLPACPRGGKRNVDPFLT